MGTLYFNVKDSCLSCECQTNIAGLGFHKAAVDFTEVFIIVVFALELYPTCEAVFVQASGKLLIADKARKNPYSGPLRFILGGINAWFFNIECAGDMVVDTLGLYTLGLPDV